MAAKTLSVTDVLFVANEFSGRNTPLPKKVSKDHNNYEKVERVRRKNHFKLTDKQKHMVLDLFEKSDLDVGTMNQKTLYGQFIRLGEILKPTLYPIQYRRTFQAFHYLRNQKRKGKPGGFPIKRSRFSPVRESNVRS